MILSIVLVMAADAAPDIISPWLTYGPLGLMIVGALFGLVWFKPAVDQLKADKAALQAQVDAMVKVNEEKVIPLLGELSAVVSEVLPALTDAARELKAAGHELRTLSSLVRADGKGGG